MVKSEKTAEKLLWEHETLHYIFVRVALAGSGAHLTSYSVGTEVIFWRVKHRVYDCHLLSWHGQEQLQLLPSLIYMISSTIHASSLPACASPSWADLNFFFCYKLWTGISLYVKCLTNLKYNTVINFYQWNFNNL